jgi:hypothetical protein
MGRAQRNPSFPFPVTRSMGFAALYPSYGPLCDKLFIQPATAVVAPPNLSAHQPAGNAASRHDDPPQMPGGWFGRAPLQSKRADVDGCQSDRCHAVPLGSSCPLQAPTRSGRLGAPIGSRDRRLCRDREKKHWREQSRSRSPRHATHSESGGHSGQRSLGFDVRDNDLVVTAIFLPWHASPEEKATKK